jgi:hypothetical protein
MDKFAPGVTELGNIPIQFPFLSPNHDPISDRRQGCSRSGIDFDPVTPYLWPNELACGLRGNCVCLLYGHVAVDAVVCDLASHGFKLATAFHLMTG